MNKPFIVLHKNDLEKMLGIAYQQGREDEERGLSRQVLRFPESMTWLQHAYRLEKNRSFTIKGPRIG